MITLMPHQIRAGEIAREHPRYGFFWDMGTGKTIAMLAAMLAENKKHHMRTLVVCPPVVIEDAWLSDAAHFPKLAVVSGRQEKGKRERIKTYATNWDTLVTSYNLFRLDFEEIMALGIERFLCDESSKLKNHKSQTTAKSIELARQCEECYMLSGTPAPNGEEEYWGQLKCIAPNDPLLITFWRYANYWMVPRKRQLWDRIVTEGWEFNESKRAAFEKWLGQYCWSLRKEDCVDLPPKTDVYRSVELTKKEFDAYANMRDKLRAEYDEGAIDATATGKLMKLRQLCGGFLYDGAGGIHNFGYSKLTELADVLDEIGEQPVVIWAEFSADIDRIKKALAAKGCCVIDGRTSDRDRKAYLDEFGKTFNYLICHPASVGHGITLVQSSYAIYYSMGFSFEQYQQSKDRIHRVGQTKPCTYIHIVAANTCDLRILEVLAKKGSRHDLIRAALSLGNINEPRMDNDQAIGASEAIR